MSSLLLQKVLLLFDRCSDLFMKVLDSLLGCLLSLDSLLEARLAVVSSVFDLLIEALFDYQILEFADCLLR